MRSGPSGCGAVVALVVSVLLTWYVAEGVHGTLEVRSAKRRAVDAVEQGLASAKQSVDRTEELAADRLRLGEPAYSWRELECDIVGTGQIATQGWWQECEVNGYRLYPASQQPIVPCDSLYPLPPPLDLNKMQVIDAQSGQLAGPDTGDGCPYAVTAPRRFVSTRVLSGRRPTDLSASPGWRLVVATARVSRTGIGCKPWGLGPFCGQPLRDAVLPGG